MQLNDLSWADDRILIADCVDNRVEMCERLYHAILPVRLQINHLQAQVMTNIILSENIERAKRFIN